MKSQNLGGFVKCPGSRRANPEEHGVPIGRRSDEKNRNRGGRRTHNTDIVFFYEVVSNFSDKQTGIHPAESKILDADHLEGGVG